MADPLQAEKAARLLQEARAGSLGVIRPDGGPYVSLVMLAVDKDHHPVLLLSDLAEHSKCLKDNDRASLMIDGSQDAAGQSQLTGARLSLVGRMQRIDDPADRELAHALYLDRHPDAAAYAGFADFHLYRFRADALHLVAGFGKIDWLEPADLG